MRTQHKDGRTRATASVGWGWDPPESERRLRRLPAQREGKCQPCGLLREVQSAPQRTGGKRQPCGLLGQRPKATRRCEQIQGPGTVSARNADICEGSETMSATGREARMIEQPGHAAGAERANPTQGRQKPRDSERRVGMGPTRKRAATKPLACTARAARRAERANHH